MSRSTAILVLFVGALVEALGDAAIRVGMRNSQVLARVCLFVLGAALLFAYGWIVNTSPWDFGRLIGLYVVFFFLTAQIVSWLAFGQLPTRPLLIGGILIVSGGLVIALLEP